MPLTDDHGRPLLTLRVAAREVGVSASTLRKAADDGRLKATKLSDEPRAPWLTTLEDAREYLRNQSTNARNARAGWDTRRARRPGGAGRPTTEG